MLKLPKYSSNGRRAHRGEESGYALLFVIFVVASIFLFAAAASPNILTEGRRQKEEEMIWRGNQYVRAIRLFYQKNGRYAQNLEELTKPNAANVHFLRKAYAEPMNKDGSWRLIYLAPTGQLVGSVHFRTLQEMAVAYAYGAQLGGSASAIAAQLFGQPTGVAASQPGQSQANQGSSSPAQPAPAGDLQAAQGPVFGGSVIGVAGKEKQPSVHVYQGSTTYFDWEFIWNPVVAFPGQVPGATPGVPTAPPGVPVPINPQQSSTPQQPSTPQQ